MPRALIIDDESGIRSALKRWFERQSWVVVEAADGDEALVKLESSSDEGSDKFDVILCDVNMPRLSGASIYERLLRDRPALIERFILSTGSDVAAAPPGSLLQRHPLVLQKPFAMSSLRGLVHTITGAPRAK